MKLPVIVPWQLINIVDQSGISICLLLWQVLINIGNSLPSEYQQLNLFFILLTQFYVEMECPLVPIIKV
jgi:hypothetical protein